MPTMDQTTQNLKLRPLIPPMAKVEEISMFSPLNLTHTPIHRLMKDQRRTMLYQNKQSLFIENL